MENPIIPIDYRSVKTAPCYNGAQVGWSGQSVEWS